MRHATWRSLSFSVSIMADGRVYSKSAIVEFPSAKTKRRVSVTGLLSVEFHDSSRRSAAFVSSQEGFGLIGASLSLLCEGCVRDAITSSTNCFWLVKVAACLSEDADC